MLGYSLEWFRDWGLGFRVQDLGFRVWVSGLRFEVYWDIPGSNHARRDVSWRPHPAIPVCSV